jgi:hypothetical protein
MGVRRLYRAFDGPTVTALDGTRRFDTGGTRRVAAQCGTRANTGARGTIVADIGLTDAIVPPELKAHDFLGGAQRPKHAFRAS